MLLQNRNPQASVTPSVHPVLRVRIWYGLLLSILTIFVVRLFYLQIIRYDHYKHAALSEQLKQKEIPATRGILYAHTAGDETDTVPFVLNQKLYVVYADPALIKNPEKTANDVASILGGQAANYQKQISVSDSRYVILAKKVSEDKEKRLLAMKHPGIGAQGLDYRTYPQGNMAGPVLGFVNDAGEGSYGIEQALDSQLKGTAGELRAITDGNGVPLASNASNVEKAAVPGKNIVLTLDVAMQQHLEQILADGVKAAQGESGSAVILDTSNGAVRAMADVPTYDPSKYYDVSDASVFNNAAVSHDIEVGSIMKALTTAAALDDGVIKPSTTYYDPAHFKVDGFDITNIEEDGGAGTRSIGDILNLSLNTGATWELMQMGGGTINTKAREAWYGYMTDHYGLGKPTGIEQGYESAGIVPSPKDNGAGIDLTYANTAFGQAMTATPIQMAAAMSAVVNGGTYYQPHLVDGTVDGSGKQNLTQPKIVRSNVVSKDVSAAMIPLLQYVIDKHYIVPAFDQSRYMVGGKTGTAQIAKPGGGYSDTDFNGTYLGFVGGDKPQYVICVFVNKPKVKGYAGTAAAQPIFVNTARMLIDDSFVAAKN